jgi:hypothetical protein
MSRLRSVVNLAACIAGFGLLACTGQQPIFPRLTGEDIYGAIDLRIARPIGMEDFRPEEGSYGVASDFGGRGRAIEADVASSLR